MSDVIHLLIVEGPEAGTELSISEDGARVGRAQKNDLTIHDPSMSRHHCRFFFKNGRLWVTDLDSANGTLVNGAPAGETGLRAGDLVHVGSTLLKVVNDGILTAALNSEETEVAERAQLNVRKRWTPSAGAAVWSSVKTLLWIGLLLWWALLVYSLIPRRTRPAVEPVSRVLAETAAQAPAVEVPATEVAVVEAAPSSSTTAPSQTGENAAQPQPEEAAPVESPPATAEAPPTPPPSADADAARLQTLKADLAKALLEESFAQAKDRLAAEKQPDNSARFSTELKRLTDFVERVSQVNDVVAATLRARVGETVVLQGKSLTLLAVSGGNVTGSMKTETGSRAVTLSISSLSPMDRGRWLGTASTPERSAMRCILHLKAKETSSARTCAEQAGPLAEALTQLVAATP